MDTDLIILFVSIIATIIIITWDINNEK